MRKDGSVFRHRQETGADFRRTAENERVNDSSVCSPLPENEKENKDSGPQKQNKLMFPPDCYKVADWEVERSGYLMFMLVQLLPDQIEIGFEFRSVSPEQRGILCTVWICKMQIDCLFQVCGAPGENENTICETDGLG